MITKWRRAACNKRQPVAADIIHGTTRHSATALPQQLSMNRPLLLSLLCCICSSDAFIAPPAASVSANIAQRAASSRGPLLHAATLSELDLQSWCETAGIDADKLTFDGDSATVTQDVAALEVLARVPRSLTLHAPRRKDWPGKLTAAAIEAVEEGDTCLLYTSPSPRDRQKSRMPSSA